MDWKPRAYWASLALLTAVAAWELTRLITYVDTAANSTLTIAYEERPARHVRISGVTLTELQRERFQVPGILVASPSRALFIVTPASRALIVPNLSPKDFSCGFSNRVFQGASPAFLITATRREALRPVPVEPGDTEGTVVAIPATLHAALSRARGSQGVISCTTARPLAAQPTFTERALTLRVQGLTGVFMLDVSALEDIDNLRFSGGVAFPLTGERTRFLDGVDNIVSFEWDDVSAEEVRDIILVVVGALAAIGAAMAIEAVRPFIEREPS